jgi:CheY-like chemotaxis protein
MQLTTKNSSRRILIADDDPVIRHLVIAIVTKMGYLPVTLNDGREACRLLYTDADFEAAILDMSMPHLAGLEVIRYMRTEKRLMRIPIILITAEQSVKLMADSFAAGAAAFLPKPFTPDQLRNVLGMLLATKTPSSRAA